MTIRHPTNRNLTLYYGNNFLGLPILQEKGPFVHEYLERLHQTTFRALGQYKRVFAFRFDLHLPFNRGMHSPRYENEFIDRFIESFKAKIKHNRRLAIRRNEYAHDTEVRYVWAREIGESGRPHYHLAVLLNYDAFCAIGKIESGRDNMFNRLQDAWASALGLMPSEVINLLHIPLNPYYHMHRDDRESVADFFERTSYLCKVATKEYGDGGHGFGCSRI